MIGPLWLINNAIGARTKFEEATSLKNESGSSSKSYFDHIMHSYMLLLLLICKQNIYEFYTVWRLYKSLIVILILWTKYT